MDTPLIPLTFITLIGLAAGLLWWHHWRAAARALSVGSPEGDVRAYAE